MFGTALYHPYIDIKDESLLRSAILFWDEIQTIVPTSIEHPYNNRSSKICEAEGYLKPLRCNLHGHLLNELGKRVLNMIQDSSGPLRIKANASSGELLHAQKFGDRLRHDLRLARIHPEKMSPELRALFPGESQGDGDWLLVNSQFADASMAALAAVLARELAVSPLTETHFAHGINLRCLIDDVKASGPSEAKGALLGITLKALRIDPEVRVEKLIQFRRARHDQLMALSAAFDGLRSAVEESEGRRELEDRAKKIYSSRIRPELNKLKGELSRNAIQSVIEGTLRGVTLSVAAGSVLAKSTGWTDELLLGAGAVITATDVAVESYFARQKARSGSAFTYLFEAERKFGRPGW